MAGRLFLSLLFCVYSFLAHSYTVETVPNPTHAHHKTFISNPDHIIDARSEEQIGRQLENIYQTTGHQIAVVIIRTIDEANPKDFANKLFEKWGIGQKKKDNGVLILMVMDQHRIEMEIGYGLEGALPDITCHRIITKHMIPNIKKGSIPIAIKHALIQIEQEIRLEKNSKPSKPQETFAESFSKIMMNLVTTSFDLIIFGFFFLLVGLFELKKIIRKKKSNFLFFAGFAIFMMIALKYFPVYINLYLLFSGVMTIKSLQGQREASLSYIYSKTGQSPLKRWQRVCFPLSLLAFYFVRRYVSSQQKHDEKEMKEKGFHFVPEAQEDGHLTSKQLKEEELHSVEHEVYVNHLTGQKEVISNPMPFSEYKTCKFCQTVSAKVVSSRTISSPTSTSSGTGAFKLECEHCHEIYEEIFTISVHESGAYSSGGGTGTSGGSGSSFGGGRSGGGGASGSW